jgi:predicted metal-dependent phosphoesterase TrpH
MTRYVDLHLHSIFSDGKLSPEELVTQAVEHALCAVALTDHDNIDGIPRMISAGRALGLEVITGVELSVSWKEYEDLHLLGYGFDFNYMPLQEALDSFRKFRMSRNLRIVDNVNQLLGQQGHEKLVFKEILYHAGGTLGRPHIGHTLITKGIVNSMDEAFQKYLIDCNEPKRFFPIGEAIRLIHQAGGCAVLAHPCYLKLGFTELKALVTDLMAIGLDGLEAFSPGASNVDIDQCISLSHTLNLIVTGGTDFHRPEQGGIMVGQGCGNLKIPYSCVEEIKKRTATKFREKNIDK